jgi:small subunit ribosomal protein S5
MPEETITKKEETASEAVESVSVSDKGTDKKDLPPRKGRGDVKKNPRRSSSKAGGARTRPEFDHKTVSIRRVTRVVAGGRRFSFSVTLVAGNRKGMVGVGQGKAGETPLAIDKAMRDAKKNMIAVKTTKDMSIPHAVSAKYGSCEITIQPAPGRGILAGSSARTVLELAGLSSVNAKILSGSKNRANIAKVTIAALQKVSPVNLRK